MGNSDTTLNHILLCYVIMPVYIQSESRQTYLVKLLIFVVNSLARRTKALKTYEGMGVFNFVLLNYSEQA